MTPLLLAIIGVLLIVLGYALFLLSELGGLLDGLVKGSSGRTLYTLSRIPWRALTIFVGFGFIIAAVYKFMPGPP